MSIKADRPQVRTAEQLEQKYNFAGMEKNIKTSETGLTKVSNELYEFVRAVAGDTSILEGQLDGTIDTWYGDEIPTLLNFPANEWDDYAEHVGDLYYDRNSGMTYSFNENNGTYGWASTENNFLAEIMAIANSAKETADNKKAVFVEVQPTPPYDNGDLWLNKKTLYVCQLSREADDTYHDGDFVLATNYIDGTQATAIGNELISVYNGQVTRMIQDTKQIIFDFETSVNSTIEGNQLDEIHNYIRFENGDIILGKGDNLYTLKIENDRINIYYNGQPISSWIQDKFSATQLNLGNFAFIPRQNGSLSFRKVK